MRVVLLYTQFWLVVMVLGVANGLLRELIYGPYLSELRAHQLSTLSLVILTGVTVALLAVWRAPLTAAQALIIGSIWLALTLSFEFLFGHFVAGHSWAMLSQDYNVFTGRVWPVFLVWIFCLPYIMFRLHETGA